MKYPFLVLVLMLSIAACADSRASASAPNASAPTTTASAAKEPAPELLTATQQGLLDLAFDAASALPTDPHAKTRARLQEMVALTALELGAFERAKACAARMDGWRRGAVLADVAYEQAKAGDSDEAGACLALARAVANGKQDESAQEWPLDRVRAKIARVELLLGRDGVAARLEQGLAPSESSTRVETHARGVGSLDFDAEVAALDAMLAGSGFDTRRQVLAGYIELHARYYADEDRRSLLEARIEAAWAELPLNLPVEFVSELADAALAHGDRVSALEFLERGHVFLAQARWAPADELPLVARLAIRRHRAGDVEKARAELDAALSTYERERRNTADVDRADVLRALAEAFHATNDTKRALGAWMRAVEESVANPNACPRAEDLVLACCSIAQSGAVPEPGLWSRLVEVRTRLAGLLVDVAHASYAVPRRGTRFGLIRS